MNIDLKGIITPTTERWGPKKTLQISMLSLAVTFVSVVVGDIVIPDYPRINMLEQITEEGD